jgi:hypothetical protein
MIRSLSVSVRVGAVTRGKVRRDELETADRQPRRRDELERVVRLDAFRQIPSEGRVVRDPVRVRPPAVGQQRHPDLQRLEAAAELRADAPEVDLVLHALRVLVDVARLGVERGLEQALVAHQHAPARGGRL